MAVKCPDEQVAKSCEICTKCKHTSMLQMTSQAMADRLLGHSSSSSMASSDRASFLATDQSSDTEPTNDRSKAKAYAVSTSEAVVLERESLTKQLIMLRSLVQKMREEAELNEPRHAAIKREIGFQNSSSTTSFK